MYLTPLDLSKMEENLMEICPTQFDLKKTLEEALLIMSFKAAKQGIELIYDVDPSVPSEAVGDACRIRQVLVNLLNNAVKFTEKGEVVLRATATEIDENTYELICSVQDTGIGIPQDRQGLLFQPFYQADYSSTRKFVIQNIYFFNLFQEGTGLGLSISKRLLGIR